MLLTKKQGVKLHWTGRVAMSPVVHGNWRWTLTLATHKHLPFGDKAGWCIRQTNRELALQRHRRMHT